MATQSAASSSKGPVGVDQLRGEEVHQVVGVARRRRGGSASWWRRRVARGRSGARRGRGAGPGVVVDPAPVENTPPRRRRRRRPGRPASASTSSIRGASGTSTSPGSVGPGYPGRRGPRPSCPTTLRPGAPPRRLVVRPGAHPPPALEERLGRGHLRGGPGGGHRRGPVGHRRPLVGDPAAGRRRPPPPRCGRRSPSPSAASRPGLGVHGRDRRHAARPHRAAGLALGGGPGGGPPRRHLQGAPRGAPGRGPARGAGGHRRRPGGRPLRPGRRVAAGRSSSRPGRPHGRARRGDHPAQRCARGPARWRRAPAAAAPPRPEPPGVLRGDQHALVGRASRGPRRVDALAALFQARQVDGAHHRR